MPFDGQKNLDEIRRSTAYRLAEEDVEFIWRPELRPVRMQLELLKPELSLEDHQVRSTIVVFGSTQIAEEPQARERLEQAEAAAAAEPNNPSLARNVQRCRQLLANR